MLDIMLPGEDGIVIFKKLRAHQNTAAVPVIMAAAKGTEYDKVIGLDSGADDYLVKPIGMMEMVSRIKAVLLAYRLSANIVRPLNNLNLENPMSNSDYEELEPLLHHIDSQQRQLQHQRHQVQPSRRLRHRTGAPKQRSF